jgi:electron transfer flavoprotein beta subunit
MKARKKEIKQIDLDSLNIGKTSSRVDILELKPAVEERKAIELKGSPEEVAEAIAKILQEEAKVIS